MSLSNLKNSIFDTFSGKPVADRARADVNHAKDYVSAMTEAIQSTSTQQQFALQKITHLSKSLSSMETKLARLEGVEAENKSLNTKTSEFKAALAEKIETVRELDHKLAAAQRQIKASQAELLSLRAESSGAKHQAAGTQGRLNSKLEEVDALIGQNSKLERNLSDMKMHNQTLQEQLSKAQGDIALYRRSESELENKLQALERAESLARQSSDETQVQLSVMTANFEQANADYIETDARLQTEQFEARAAQTQFSDSLRRREEEILSQKNRIEHLESQLAIKESAHEHAQREITEAKHSLHLASLRAQELESRSHEASRQAEASASNVIRSQSEYDALNAKFIEALADIDTLKQLNQIQKSKLVQYAAVDNTERAFAPTASASSAQFAPKPEANQAAATPATTHASDGASLFSAEPETPKRNIRVLRRTS